MKSANHKFKARLASGLDYLIQLTWFLQAGGSSALLMDLAANEKSVHSDFFNGKY